MKKIYILFIMMLLASGSAVAQEAPEKADDPAKLFYAGNSYYEKREYEKAVDAYSKILNTGITSGNLYYNLGNSYFKLGKTGYAVLYYEKARRIMPQDGDLKANLAYAKSQVEAAMPQSRVRQAIAKAIRAPFRDFNLNAVTILTISIYLALIGLSFLFILKPYEAKKFRFVYAIITAVFLWSLAAFAMRYYWEVLVKHAVVVQRIAECKYEPIDNSNTYFKLSEGEVVAVQKAYGDWTKIRSSDGKTAWTKSSAVEEI